MSVLPGRDLFRNQSAFTTGAVNAANGGGPIDWNCDGSSNSVGLTANVNGDWTETGTELPPCHEGTELPVYGTLLDSNDWSLIRYDFQTTAGFEDGSPPESPAEPELDYLTASTLLASELSVSQTASPNPVVTGSNVTYTIVVANTGSSAASLVTVTDDLPATVSFVSCSATGGGVCGGSGNNRTISFPVLAGGNSATITLVANVTCALANGTLIDNTAAVSTPSPEQDPNNNSVTVTVTASNPPPVIRNASVSTPVIRPAPNHTLDSETVNYTVTDNCGPVTSSLSVTSNEPVNGLGDAPIKPPIG